MSKVKQNIDEARDFAGAQPEEAASNEQKEDQSGNQKEEAEKHRKDYVARKEQTVLVDEAKEGVVYSSEQALRNLAVKEAIVHSTESWISLTKEHHATVKDLRRAESDKVVQCVEALRVFHRDFLIVAEGAAAPEDIVADLKLSAPADLIKKYNERLTGMQEQLKLAPQTLYAPNTDKKGKGRGIYFDSLEPLSVNLLEDSTITSELLQPLKVLACSDVFVLLRQEVKESQDDIEILRQQIKKMEDQKSDFVTKDELQEVERLAFEQIALHGVVLEKHRKKLETIFLANSDVQTFTDNYQLHREQLEERLATHNSTLDQQIETVVKDIDTAKEALDTKYAEALAAEEAHDAWKKESGNIIQGYVDKQASLWSQILDLLQQVGDTADKYQSAMVERINKCDEESRRKADTDKYISGLETHLKSLESGKGMLQTAKEWNAELQSFLVRMSDEIEAKNVVDEAYEIRITAQRKYLEDYQSFKDASNKLLETQTARQRALNILKRNLEFQIREAVHTLDPNTKKYRGELVVIEDQLHDTDQKVATLTDNIKRESTLWRPTEEQMEDAGLDFTPPDIEADKERVRLKVEALGIQREFINGEQERVDRDAVELRKFKTSSQIAAEAAKQRRQETLAIEGGAPAAAASGETSPTTKADSEATPTEAPPATAAE
jgi:hypothetical protein